MARATEACGLLLVLCTVLCLLWAVDGYRFPKTSKRYEASITKCSQPGGFCLVRRKGLPQAVAQGIFADRRPVTGWGELHISTSGDFSDYDQAYAAGFLEGALTHRLIVDWISIVRQIHPQATFDDWFVKQEHYLRSKLVGFQFGVKDKLASRGELSDDERFWYHVWLVVAQLDGLLAGFNKYCDPGRQLRLIDLMYINSEGDVMDLERFLPARSGRSRHFKPASQMSFAELIELVDFHSHCSAMIKWTKDDLFAGHITWDDYQELIRMYKHYQFSFSPLSRTAAQGASFSAYPGLISSTDDFYVLSSRLVVIETTINVLDDELWKKCSPEGQVLSWVRATVANRLAKNGPDWVRIFPMYNSGTYNDQWMIVDYKLFEPGSPKLQSNTIWLLEQIPGFFHTLDASQMVQNRTYWASYNRPYFRDIAQKSKYTYFAEQHGSAFSHEACVRANIFRNQQSKVRTFDDFQSLMRYNDYKNDRDSAGCSADSIAPRFDLIDSHCRGQRRRPGGAIDAKATNYKMASQMKAMAVCGPVTGPDMPPFSWAAFPEVHHPNQPERINYRWTVQQPLLRT